MIYLAVALWLVCFAIDKGSRVPYARRGGGTDPTPTPVQQAPTETSAQAIQAQITALPQILEAQREFGPQFQEEQLASLREFGPQFTEEAIGLTEQFGGRLAEQTRAEQAILAPERVAGSQAVADFISGGPDTLTPQEERDFRQDIRAAQQTRGLAQSGFGVQDELERLTRLRQDLKNRFLDVSLSASGRLPAAGQATIGQPQQQGQLVQNVTPSQIFSAQAASEETAASIFKTRFQPGTPGFNTRAAILGGVSGGLQGFATGGPAGAFGGAAVGGIKGGLS